MRLDGSAAYTDTAEVDVAEIVPSTTALSPAVPRRVIDPAIAISVSVGRVGGVARLACSRSREAAEGETADDARGDGAAISRSGGALDADERQRSHGDDEEFAHGGGFWQLRGIGQ